MEINRPVVDVNLVVLDGTKAFDTWKEQNPDKFIISMSTQVVHVTTPFGGSTPGVYITVIYK